MKITTNNIPRAMVSFFDLPEDVKSDFDYISEDDKYDYRFVSYKSCYYDVYDTQRIAIDNGCNGRFDFCMFVSPDSILAMWNSIISESFFSGVLFRLCEDDNVIVGRYFS